MRDYEHYTEELLWHNALKHFGYDRSIDWAISLIQHGIETENVLTPASFSKPVNKDKIRLYLFTKSN